MEEVRVVSYGVGAVGSLIAKTLLEKSDIKVVGAIDVAKDKVGRDLGEFLGLNKLDVTISSDTVLSKTKPNITVHATLSYYRDNYT